jgi:hypothetical protein
LRASLCRDIGGASWADLDSPGFAERHNKEIPGETGTGKLDIPVAANYPVKIWSDGKMAKWTLNRGEVAGGVVGSSSTTKKGQFSRRLKRTSSRLSLTHIPTGINVTGEVPEGHYSKKEMRQLQSELYEKLFLQLEAKVGKHLRAPGR